MLAVERGAVVDQPGLVVPGEEVRVARGAVDVGDQGIEEDDVGRQPGVEILLGGKGEGQSSGQEVHAQVGPRACLDQFLDLRVRFGVTEFGGHVDQHQFRHRQSDLPGYLPGHHLRHQRSRALAGAAKLDHPGAVVVTFDQPRQGAAFAERSHVPVSVDAPQPIAGSLFGRTGHLCSFASG